MAYKAHLIGSCCRGFGRVLQHGNQNNATYFETHSNTLHEEPDVVVSIRQKLCIIMQSGRVTLVITLIIILKYCRKTLKYETSRLLTSTRMKYRSNKEITSIMDIRLRVYK